MPTPRLISLLSLIIGSEAYQMRAKRARNYDKPATDPKDMQTAGAGSCQHGPLPGPALACL